MQEPPVRDDGLQLEEHPRFQSTFWQMERVAWVLFTAILLLALAGLTGAGGYLSKRSIELAGGELQVPRVARWGTADEIRVRFDAGRSPYRLTLGQRFYDYFAVEAIQPQPERSMSSADGTAMEFSTLQRGSAQVVLYVRPLRPGLPRYSVHLNTAQADVSVLILP